MNIPSIRDGLKTRLATISGLECYDTQPSKPEVPAAVVTPDEPFIDLEQAMQGGLAEVRFRVVLLVQMGDDESWQNQLDGYLSSGTGETTSVADAIAADRTLGGVTTATVVERVDNYGTVAVGNEGIEYGSATVHIVTRPSRT